MSFSHDKGYRAERKLELLLQELGNEECYRPRAGRPGDVGDIAKVPLVVSVKDRVRLALAGWCDDLTRMVARSAYDTGVVWHHRQGRGDPRNWFVTTTAALYAPLLDWWLVAGKPPPVTTYIPPCRRILLGPWCDELSATVADEGAPTGVIVHPRVGRGEGEWYVTTTGKLFLPLYERWCER